MKHDLAIVWRQNRIQQKWFSRNGYSDIAIVWRQKNEKNSKNDFVETDILKDKGVLDSGYLNSLKILSINTMMQTQMMEPDHL